MLLTYWGEILPMLYDNEEPGRIYFEKVLQALAELNADDTWNLKKFLCTYLSAKFELNTILYG